MNMGYLLTWAAQRYGARTAWIDGERRVSFSEAEERVSGLAQTFLDLGAKHGDRVSMILPNCLEAVETIIAPMKVGMAIVPLNNRLSAREYIFILNNAGVSVLVYGQEYQDIVEEIRSQCPNLKWFIRVGDDGKEDVWYDDAVKGSDSQFPEIVYEPDQLAWLFYTSGTTGNPKGAMLSQRNLMVMMQQILLDMNPAIESDVILHAAPVTHGSGMLVFENIARGAANAFIPGMESFDPTRIFEAIEKYHVTTMFAVPTMVRLMTVSPDISRFDLSGLHTVVYGGGPMYTEHLEEALAIFGPIFVQLYGQAEAPMICTVLPKEDHIVDGDPVRKERLGSAGRPVFGVHLAILDEEGQELPSGGTGEICVRGDLVMLGYWDNPDATAEALRNGWLHTGDVGHLDESGYLFITDRMKDMIISGGANVYPREVEEAICKHPAVYEAAVIGVPDEKWGEAVKAFVALRPDFEASEGDIIEHCRHDLAGYKKPKTVEFMDKLPKNAYGKILRRELRAPYWSQSGRKV